MTETEYLDMVKDVLNVLRVARRLIDNPELWCQRVSSHGVGKTMARCASKAISDAAEAIDPDVRWTAAGLLASAAGVDILVLWNDAWGRTHQDVMAAFDRAIASCVQP